MFARPQFWSSEIRFKLEISDRGRWWGVGGESKCRKIMNPHKDIDAGSISYMILPCYLGSQIEVATSNNSHPTTRRKAIRSKWNSYMLKLEGILPAHPCKRKKRAHLCVSVCVWYASMSTYLAFLFVASYHTHTHARDVPLHDIKHNIYMYTYTSVYLSIPVSILLIDIPVYLYIYITM